MVLGANMEGDLDQIDPKRNVPFRVDSPLLVITTFPYYSYYFTRLAVSLGAGKAPL